MAKKISDLVTTSHPLSGSEKFEINQTVNGSLGSYSVSAGAIKTYIEKNSLVMISYKNKLINGDFNIWRRATSQTSSSYDSDDRWKNTHNGSTKTHSQQAFTLGQTDVPGEPIYYSRTVVSSSAGASNFVSKYQRIESVRTFAGQTCILSFYAKADASKNIAVEFTQSFGTGGSPSSIITGIEVTTYALTTGWQKFESIVNIPSISGKTLGTNDDDCLQLNFWFDAGSNYNYRTNSLGQQSGTFDIARVQLEKGSVATEFEDRHIGQELALCQRYFCKSYNIDVNPGTITDDGRCSLYLTNMSNSDHYMQFDIKFLVEMRAIPTITTYSDNSGTSGKVRMIAGDVTPDVVNPSKNSLYVGATNGAASTSRLLIFHYTADAEL